MKPTVGEVNMVLIIALSSQRATRRSSSGLWLLRLSESARWGIWRARGFVQVEREGRGAAPERRLRRGVRDKTVADGPAGSLEGGQGAVRGDCAFGHLDRAVAAWLAVGVGPINRELAHLRVGGGEVCGAVSCWLGEARYCE